MAVFECSVLQDGRHQSHKYRVTAPTKKLAMVLALAADGGFYDASHGPASPPREIDYEQEMATASSYVEAVELRPGGK